MASLTNDARRAELQEIVPQAPDACYLLPLDRTSGFETVEAGHPDHLAESGITKAYRADVPVGLLCSCRREARFCSARCIRAAKLAQIGLSQIKATFVLTARDRATTIIAYQEEWRRISA